MSLLKSSRNTKSFTRESNTNDTITRSYLLSSGSTAAEKAGNKAGATRDDLMSAAQSHYAEASKSGGSAYASVTSYLAKQTDAAKDSAFDTWSDSELKAYLDSYGVVIYYILYSP